MDIFSDNTPTIAWATKLSAKGSMIARRLLRQYVTQSAPVVAMHVAGEENGMSDDASCRFKSKHNKKQEETNSSFSPCLFSQIHITDRALARVLSLFQLECERDF